MTDSLLHPKVRPMARVTGKFQLTLPKRLVEAYGIRVGDEVELVGAGENIAIVPARAARAALSTDERLRHFDRSTARQRERESGKPVAPAKDRGWTRDDLYRRGGPR